jgi:transcriptional regulator with AAA-type ATPase domain
VDTAAGLVGREQVLAALREALAATASGRGQLVLLAGEPGIGKTALATALATAELAAHLVAAVSAGATGVAAAGTFFGHIAYASLLARR